MNYNPPSKPNPHSFSKRGRGNGRGGGRGDGRGGGRGDGRGDGKGDGRGDGKGDGRGDGKGDGRSSGRSPAQDEMKRQCEIMYSIVRPEDDKLRFKYQSDNGNVVDMTPEMAYCINGTIYRKYFYDPFPKVANKENCVINVNHYTTIKTARYLHSKNYDKICIMNFASPFKAGGGYDHGQLSQESSIVSQTLLFGSLLSRTALPFYDSNSKSSHNQPSMPNKKPYNHKYSPKAKHGSDSDSSSGKKSGRGPYQNKPNKNHHHQRSKIDLSPYDNGFIYSPRVPVIADGEAGTSAIPNANSGKKVRDTNKFTMFDKKDVFYVDVISVSPVNKSQIIKVYNSPDVHRQVNKLMEKKIRNTIYMAAMRAEYLVLGAFGCGSFGNDPKIIARMFRRVLVKEKYADYFKGIEFSMGSDKPCYDAFNNEFRKSKNHTSDSDNDDDDDDSDDDEKSHESYGNSEDDYDNDRNHSDDEDSDKPKDKKKKKESYSSHKDSESEKHSDDEDSDKSKNKTEKKKWSPKKDKDDSDTNSNKSNSD